MTVIACHFFIFVSPVLTYRTANSPNTTAKKGKLHKITALYSKADLKSSSINDIAIRDTPQPGHFNPVTILNTQGIPNPKYDVTA